MKDVQKEPTHIKLSIEKHCLPDQTPLPIMVEDMDIIPFKNNVLLYIIRFFEPKDQLRMV